MKQQRQELEQKQQSVNKQQSLLLIKNMIRLSISSICYVRDIFPADTFESKAYGNSNFQQLVAAATNDATGEIEIKNKDAFTLTQWLEQGVFDALANEYLKAIRFYILTKHPLSGEYIPIESYEFKITYDDDSNTVELNGAKMLSRDDLKMQASKFVRSLVEFTGTLDTLPDDRVLTMSIAYTDNAPEEYEPKFFRGATGKEFMFLGKPMKVKVGSLLTPHQEMIMRFTGFDSLLEEDLRALAPGQQASGKDSHTKTSFQGSSHALPSPTPSGMYTACRGRVVSSEVDPDAVSANSIVTPALSTHTEVRRLFLSQSQELAPTDMLAMGNLNLSAPPATLPPQTPAPKQASLAAVRDFMLRETKSTASNCVKFLGLTLPEVQAALNYMVNDGLLSCQRRTYSVTTASQAEPSYPSTMQAAPSVTGNSRWSTMQAAPSVTGNSRWSTMQAAPSVTGNSRWSTMQAAPSVTGNSRWPTASTALDSTVHTPPAVTNTCPGVQLPGAPSRRGNKGGNTEMSSTIDLQEPNTGVSTKRDRETGSALPEFASKPESSRMQLSQDSQVSVASGQSNASGGHGSSRKRARPDSIIRDPLHVPTPKLVALHSSSSVCTGTGAGRVGSALSGGSKITGSRPVTTQSRTSSAPASRFRPQ